MLSSPSSAKVSAVRLPSQPGVYRFGGNLQQIVAGTIGTVAFTLGGLYFLYLAASGTPLRIEDGRLAPPEQLWFSAAAGFFCALGFLYVAASQALNGLTLTDAAVTYRKLGSPTKTIPLSEVQSFGGSVFYAYVIESEKERIEIVARHPILAPFKEDFEFKMKALGKTREPKPKPISALEEWS